MIQKLHTTKTAGRHTFNVSPVICRPSWIMELLSQQRWMIGHSLLTDSQLKNSILPTTMHHQIIIIIGTQTKGPDSAGKPNGNCPHIHSGSTINMKHALPKAHHPM